MARLPYAEPYSRREKIGMSTYRLRVWWKRFRHEAVWWWIAFHLPRRVVLFAFVRVMSYASTRIESGTRHPDSITYSEAYKAWEKNGE